MRAAPPVEAVLDSGRLERMLITALHALAGAVVAAWLALHLALGPGWAVLLVGLGAAAVVAGLGHQLARRALPLQPGQLRWDGQRWFCVGAQGMPVQPLQRLVLALDLGLWVLLHLHPADGGHPVWRVASARGATSAWHGLRVALAAHAGSTATDRGDPAT